MREFDDIPLIAEFGATLRSAMVAAEAAEAAPSLQAKKRPWWKSFRLFGSVLVLGLVGTGATAATLTILRGSPIPAPRAADLQPAMTARAATQRVLSVRAADPARTLPAFALRTGQSLGGLTCVTVGEVRHGSFGLVGADRTFRALAPTFVDGCGAVTGTDAAVAGARVLDAPSYDDVRTVVYAVGGPSLRTAAVVARGVRHTVRVADGAAIAAFKGYPEDSALELVLGFAGGKTVKHHLGGGTQSIVDPDGPAWAALTESSVHDGVFTWCVGLTRVRTSLTTPTTAPVCDPPLSKDRNSTRNASTLDPYYFETRTFHPGDHGGTKATTWSWHDAPARTVVWGAADSARVRRVVITAPGEPSRSLSRSSVATIGAVFPASVPASAVHVTVTMRDGSVRRFGGAAGGHRIVTP